MKSALFGCKDMVFSKEEIELLKTLVSRCKLDGAEGDEKRISTSLSNKFSCLDNPLSSDTFCELSFIATLTVSTITVLRKEHHA